MADLGTLRTFVNNFKDALDILDEAERIKSTTEERRQELTAVTAEWQQRVVDRDRMMKQTQEAQAAGEQALRHLQDVQVSVAQQEAAARASLKAQLGRLEEEYDQKIKERQATVAVLEGQIKDRRAQIEEATEQLEKTRATMRTLASLIKQGGEPQ